MKVILYDNITIEGKEYDKKKFFDFLIQERKNSKLKYVKSRERYGYTEYTLRMNLEFIKLYFPNFNSSKNAQYESIIQTWASYDRKKCIMRLKIMGLLLASGIVVSKSVEYSDNIVDKVIEFIDEQKFNWDNIGKFISINDLENELRSHSGHGEIEGYSQSVQEHLNGTCYLDKPETRQELYTAISEYCEEKGLGTEVSDEACQKYDFLYLNDMYNANQIDLKDVYKEGKQKTHTNN